MITTIRLLTNACCDRLLTFQTNSTLRSHYDLEDFPSKELEELKLSTNLSFPEGMRLVPTAEQDVNSSIAVFSAMKDLDRVQANDRRLWVALTHGAFFEYTKERWMKKESYSNEAILRRFHFEGSSLEARMRNAVSRLWWVAKLTYDEGRGDPFELTKLIWRKQDLMQNLVERSYGTYESVLKGFLDVYRLNSGLKDEDLRQLYKGLNAIGGVKVLALLTVTDVKEELARIADFRRIKLQLS